MSDYPRVRAIFLAALERPAGEQGRFVEDEAGGDLALRDEVLSLLAHQGGPLLREPEPPPPADAPDPIGAIGAVIDGRYQVLELVGEGGFSYVYRGEQLRLRRQVALKFFNEQRSEQRAALERAFINEGALLSELSRRTTTIVQSYDAGTWSRGGQSWLFTVLEWLDGETLARRLARERAAGAAGWPVAQVVTTLDPIVEALAIAFDLGVAHRDLKPGNVFLATIDGRVVPKLLDFGTAKVASGASGFGKASSIVGVYTIAYAAPEQVSRALGPTGPWTDVYALALLCIELLLGRPPFTRADLAAMARRIHTGTSLAPRDVGLAVTPAVDAVLARSLATRPDDRYPDVRQFWAALRSAMDA